MTTTASLVAEVSTKGARKAESELKGVSKQAKRTEENVTRMGGAFQSVSRNASAAAAATHLVKQLYNYRIKLDR